MKLLIDRLLRLKLIFFIVLYSGFEVQAQDESIRPQNVKIASPNAAALGKVADIPIGYHTGIPNIEIPIYTVQEGPLTMPISIAYHASGLKVTEQSSWVGAGWSLNAGGVITRAVRGMPDEVLSSSGSPTPISYLNNHGYYEYLFMENPSEFTPQILPNAPSGQKQILATHEFGQGRRDGEADMFNFNFNGYSGKFYFRPDNSVAFTPDQDIAVTPLFCSSSNPNCSQTNEYLYGWIVTTPDGVRYHFGKDLSEAGNYNSTNNAVPLEYTTSYSSTSGLSYNKTASSWFLNKIESPDKKFSISLVYSAEEYAYYTLSLFPKSSYGSADYGIDLVKNIMIGVRLSTIKFSNNSQVEFIPSTSVREDLSGPNTNLMDIDVDPNNPTAPRALGEIKISNNLLESFCQSFVFSYGYFNDASHSLTGYLANLGSQFNLHSDKKRLKLNALTEKSCNGNVIKPSHQFTYFDAGLVPRTLSFAQDHWGYFNGNTSNPSMLPPISIDNGLTNLPATYGNRDSKWPEMRAGALEKIEYPTGGHTRFVFNSHDVYTEVGLYDSLNIGYKNAAFTATSSVTEFTITTPTTFKARVNYPYYSNYSSGYVHIVNTSTNFDYGTASSSQGLHIFELPAGTYQYSVQCTSNTFYPIECTLWQIVPTYSQWINVVVGGLRIDSLIYNNGLDNVQKTQAFEYEDENGTNQGVLFSRPAYVSLVKNYAIIDHGGLPPGNYYTTESFLNQNGCIAGDGESGNPTDFLFFVSANAILPLVTSQGNHFGYNYVKVIEADGGYTEYRFKLSANQPGDVCTRVIDHNDCDELIPNYPPAPEPFKPDRGEMISKSVYNSSNILLYKEVYANDYQYEEVGVQGWVLKPIPITGGDLTGSAYLTTEYEWKSAKKVKSTTETFSYNANNLNAVPVYKKTEVFFESIRHNQPTHTVISDEEGKVLKEVRSTYVGDMIVPSCPDLESGLNIIDANLNAALAIELSMYNPNSCGANDSTCRFEKWLKQKYYSNLDRIASVNERITLINNYKTCMSGTTPNWSWSSASPELKAIVKLKNRNQVYPIIERSQWRDGKFLSAESITYQDFAVDTLSIYPGKVDLINVASPLPAASFSPISLNATTVTRDSKYVAEENYTYDNGNIVEVLGKNGVKTSYLWGYDNTLPIAKAVGVSYATLLAAYVAVNEDLEALRDHSSMDGAQVTTYTYDPLVGLTSQTDSNGVTTYYSYDELGRLELIRDNNNDIVKKHQYKYAIH